MNYEIHFVVACDKGKVRDINQDNFLCNGEYLEAENNGLDENKSGRLSVLSEQNMVFAVFDGMGGEQDGEVAAHIAARKLDELHRGEKGKNEIDIENFLIGSCEQINDEIVDYAKQKQADCIGTTAAVVALGEKEIYACNIGDSKIYRYHNRRLTQISKDHVVATYKNRKSPLYQFLGIPKNELSPHILCKPYKNNDVYLICSDGLTDMLTEKEIKIILSKNKEIKDCVDKLLDNALEKGGKDNITIILCKIEKIKSSTF